MMKIESLQNSRIKKVVKLRKRSFRDETGLTIVDGLREIRMALQGGVSIEEAFVCPAYLKVPQGDDLLQRVKKKDVPLHEVTQDVFDKIAFGDRKEGIVAVCQTKKKKISQLKAAKDSFYVVFDQVEKPGNLGAVLRSCDGGGVDALIVCDPKTDIYNPNVIRSSCGVVFTVPVFQDDKVVVEKFLSEEKIKIISVTPDAEISYTDINYPKGGAFVFGSEQEGLDEFWVNKAGKKISIPMQGKADSLNVSVSAAIVIYEALRQRGG